MSRNNEGVQPQSRALSLGFVAAAAALLLFAFVARVALSGQSAQFDAYVRNGVHAWASPSLTYIMRGLTLIGSAWFLLTGGMAVVAALARAGRKRAALLLVAATFGGEALDQILKMLFRRPRPEAFFGLAEPFTYSFPSGHATTAACFYGVLAAILAARTSSLRLKIALWTFAALMASAIGLSRIYLGVHYPTDVVAGYAAAVIWVAAVRAGYGIWLRRARARQLASTHDGRPVLRSMLKY
jgi:undecaprenyl-diphosphatase